MAFKIFLPHFPGSPTPAPEETRRISPKPCSIISALRVLHLIFFRASTLKKMSECAGPLHASIKQLSISTAGCRPLRERWAKSNGEGVENFLRYAKMDFCELEHRQKSKSEERLTIKLPADKRRPGGRAALLCPVKRADRSKVRHRTD